MPGPVACYQWEPEFRALLKIYKKLAPQNVLEIGTYCGGTLFHWLDRAVEGATVVSVDSYDIVAATGGTDNRELYDIWKPLDVNLVVIDGDSRAATTIEQARVYEPFDFIFIDAGHHYEEVRDDWENYRPMARDGAVVAFHDILPPSRTWPEIEVAWLWKEIKQYGWRTEEIVNDWNAEWGGIGVVYL